MSVLQILKDARKLIEKPEGWTKGTTARDFRGRAIGWDEPEACRFCATAAIAKARLSTRGPFDAARDTLNTEAIIAGHSGIVEFNDADATTHADVLALFDRAIASLEARHDS